MSDENKEIVGKSTIIHDDIQEKTDLNEETHKRNAGSSKQKQDENFSDLKDKSMDPNEKYCTDQDKNATISYLNGTHSTHVLIEHKSNTIHEYFSEYSDKTQTRPYLNTNNDISILTSNQTTPISKKEKISRLQKNDSEGEKNEYDDNIDIRGANHNTISDTVDDIKNKNTYESKKETNKINIPDEYMINIDGLGKNTNNSENLSKNPEEHNTTQEICLKSVNLAPYALDCDFNHNLSISNGDLERRFKRCSSIRRADCNVVKSQFEKSYIQEQPSKIHEKEKEEAVEVKEEDALLLMHFVRSIHRSAREHRLKLERAHLQLNTRTNEKPETTPREEKQSLHKTSKHMKMPNKSQCDQRSHYNTLNETIHIHRSNSTNIYGLSSPHSTKENVHISNMNRSDTHRHTTRKHTRPTHNREFSKETPPKNIYYPIHEYQESDIYKCSWCDSCYIYKKSFINHLIKVHSYTQVEAMRYLRQHTHL